MGVKKTKDNQKQKTVYFNTEDPLEKELYEYSQSVGSRNFSGFVKSLIYKEMQSRGGQPVSPYEYMNVLSDAQAAAPQAAPVQAEKPKLARKPKAKPEPVKEPVEEEVPVPEVEEEQQYVPEEEVPVSYEPGGEVYPEVDDDLDDDDDLQLDDVDDDEDDMPEEEPEERVSSRKRGLQNLGGFMNKR